MTPTRIVTLLVFLIGSAGLATLSIADSLTTTVAASALVVGAAIYMVRHFWRESANRNKQELASQMRHPMEALTELRQSGLELESSLRSELQRITARVDAFARGVLEYVSQVQLDLEKTRLDLAQDLAKGEADLTSSTQDLEKADERAKRAADHMMSQVLGVVGIYATLKPDLPYPPFGGWAVSGDCARRLVELVMTVRPSWVIEVGSGLSTLLIAQALEIVGGDGRVLALEHEKQWLDKSTALLALHGMAHRADVSHAPLEAIDLEDERFNWYDLSAVSLPDEAEVIFIDGPPKATGPLARYPALPLLIDRLVPGGVILMDDANRPDERAAIQRWQEEIPGLEVIFHSDAKGTVELRRGQA